MLVTVLELNNVVNLCSVVLVVINGSGFVISVDNLVVFAIAAVVGCAANTTRYLKLVSQ